MIEPKLRFKKDDGSDFPDWEEKKLGDVCDTLTYGMNAAAVKFDGENKYIRITDIDDESHCYKNDELVSPDGELDNKYLVCENDILLARTGASVGKSYLYNKEDGKLYYAGFLIKAHVKSENSKFIFFQTLTERYDKWVKITSMRSGQPGINANEYSDFTMNVPSLPEQQKIADFLSTIDTIIEKQRATVSAWEERKKGVMQKLFSQEVRFKADDGSDFPDWEEKKFLDCISKIVDFRGRTPLKLGMAWSEEKTEHLALSALNVKMGYIDENIDAHYGNKKLYDMWMDGNELYKGQVLFTTEAPMGNVAQVPDNKPYILSQRTIAFVPKYDLLHDDFLVVLLSSSNVQRRLDTLATGGTAKGISQKSLKNFNVKIPCDLDEQQKIADCLSALDTVIRKQKETLEKWQELKKGLLQQMFV